MMMKLRARAGVAAVIGIVAAAAPASARAQFPVPYGAAAVQAFVNGELFTPTSVVGANNGCRPTVAHPFPVVLVHGTIEDEGSNWVTLAPLLANNGYCVFALNYGQTQLSFGDRVDGLGDIPTSAMQLSAFIHHVLRVTGASQVDVVGHSQGGMMPGYYLRFLGGASRVHVLIGLAPSNHGTTVNGLVTLIDAIPGLPALVANTARLLGAPSLTQQTVGSMFMTKLFAHGDTVPGPRYVVIETNHDEIVTPYTNAFLSAPNATNILVQNQCPGDPVAHVGISFDGPALQDVLNQLSNRPSGSFRPTCTNFGVAF
jgi:triacylglycerol esterase/lipase EstA (alpha/beta hydrolase family)